MKIGENTDFRIYFVNNKHKMERELKERLKKEIEIYLLKYPLASTTEVIKFLKQGDQLPQFSEVKHNTLSTFVRYQRRKF